MSVSKEGHEGKHDVTTFIIWHIKMIRDRKLKTSNLEIEH